MTRDEGNNGRPQSFVFYPNGTLNVFRQVRDLLLQLGLRLAPMEIPEILLYRTADCCRSPSWDGVLLPPFDQSVLPFPWTFPPGL